jgi:nitroreductase
LVGGREDGRLKLRLQFTGWLQYLPVAAASVLFFLLAAVGSLVGVWRVALVRFPAAVAVVLLLTTAFDLLTVKAGVRPLEPAPAPAGGLDAFALMRSRRACRSFQSTDLGAEHRAALMASVADRSGPDRLIGDKPVRFEYVSGHLTVWPVVGAHEFLVAIAPREYDRLAVVDVGRSLQRVVLDATAMGLATCWIGPGADHDSIVAHLGTRFDPGTDHIICVCAVGYRSRYLPVVTRLIGVVQHHRLPLSELFFADPGLRTPLDVGRPPFSAFGRCYEVCQWSPSSYNSQTTRCVAVAEPADGGARAARFDFYAATASRYYAAVALGIWCADWEAGCEALAIPGHFSVLAPVARGVRQSQEPPHYDVSWVVDAAETA